MVDKGHETMCGSICGLLMATRHLSLNQIHSFVARPLTLVRRIAAVSRRARVSSGDGPKPSREEEEESKSLCCVFGASRPLVLSSSSWPFRVRSASHRQNISWAAVSKIRVHAFSTTSFRIECGDCGADCAVEELRVGEWADRRRRGVAVDDDDATEPGEGCLLCRHCCCCCWWW